MDLVRKLITEKLEEKRLSMKDVSLKIGHAHSYLYQFLKLGSPRELHERDRAALATALGITEDELRGPSSPIQKRSYTKNALHKEVSSNHSGASILAYVKEKGVQPTVVPASDYLGNIDFPVFGTALGASGALIMTKWAVDQVARPAMLLRVRDAYGLIVSGDTMAPMHRAGSVALINPHLPPRVDDTCVFRCVSDDGGVHVLVKEYRGQTETHWRVRQYNPPKDYTLKKSDWTDCHRIVAIYLS